MFDFIAVTSPIVAHFSRYQSPSASVPADADDAREPHGEGGAYLSCLFFQPTSEPFLDLRVTGNAFASRHAVDLQNHPARQVEIHAVFAQERSARLREVEIVEHIGACIEARLQVLGCCFTAHSKLSF